ncbi:alpha/beta hydrolase [Planotetraspora thailandica]|uniref:Alpha/beta hydrolase n=1 Tax=Planotetraspora thailandica TaxID=487172 RepID=A0A8J3V156_9ACTN|nr:alpha/beta hydrolase [Planotetraspora thailandica]GII55382.1 alpha/beta hydrolase [Planotetraspora thailandica]
MQFDHVNVPGGRLRIARFGEGPRIILAAHGITASLMAWRTVAEALPPGWSLVAPDLRGRGHSADASGPYGLPRHADDLDLVADHVGADETSVLTGHSLGAYIAALHGAKRRYARVVLVDGGLPLPMPPGADPDAVQEASLGPAIQRLRQTYPSIEAYLDFFRAHPSFVGHWTSAVEEYVRYDATGEGLDGGAVRSRVREEAVRQDGRWFRVEVEEIAAALEAIESPLSLLRAPRGLLNEEGGLLPEDLTAAWLARLPEMRHELIGDCNHYTILFDPRCAAVVADRLTAEQ